MGSTSEDSEPMSATSEAMGIPNVTEVASSTVSLDETKGFDHVFEKVMRRSDQSDLKVAVRLAGVEDFPSLLSMTDDMIDNYGVLTDRGDMRPVNPGDKKLPC